MNRRLRKLRRDPARFFSDATSPWMRALGRVVGPVAAGRAMQRMWRVLDDARLDRLAPVRKVSASLDARSSAERQSYLATCGSPLVSVIVPVRDAGRFLAGSLDSLREQSYPHWEAVVVDDKSGDDSLAIARRASECDGRVRAIASSEARGAAAARNVGLALARGDVLCFQDADDRSHPQRLERQLYEMLRSGRALCTCNYHRETTEGTLVVVNGRRDMFSVISMMFTRSLFEQVGYLRPLVVGEDSDFYERLRDASGSSCHVDKTLYFATFSRDSLMFSHGRTVVEGDRVDFQVEPRLEALLERARIERRRLVPFYVPFELPPGVSSNV